MSALDDWLCWMSTRPAPLLFKQAGLYFMVSSCLQRRVYLGSKHAPLWGNPYFLLVATPGVGKGNVTREVRPIMTGLKRVVQNAHGGKIGEEKLIPLGADSINFETLTRDMANNVKFFRPLKDEPAEVYHPISFVLEEFTTVFHRENPKLLDFLIQTFDCGNFDYKTKHQGEDCLMNCFVSILAGTQPSRMDGLRRQAVMGSGFMSRFICIYAEEDDAPPLLRFPAPTEEQLAAKARLVKFCAALSEQYGGMEVTPEADAIMYQQLLLNKNGGRTNTAPVLDEYYVRWNMHVQKIAMCHAKSRDADTWTVTAEDAAAAVKFLTTCELSMHTAFAAQGRNPLASIGDQIIAYINRHKGGLSFNTIHVAFHNQILDANELNKLLTSLESMGRIKKIVDPVKGKVTYVGI